MAHRASPARVESPTSPVQINGINTQPLLPALLIPVFDPSRHDLVYATSHCGAHRNMFGCRFNFFCRRDLAQSISRSVFVAFDQPNTRCDLFAIGRRNIEINEWPRLDPALPANSIQFNVYRAIARQTSGCGLCPEPAGQLGNRFHLHLDQWN